MSHNKVSLAGMVGSVPKTVTIREDLTYTSFDLFTEGSYQNEAEEEVGYHERHRIICVGTLDTFARSVRMGAHLVVEGELRSHRETLDLNHRVDIQITFRVWEVVANSIQPDIDDHGATQERDTAAALIARYYWPE